MNEEIQYVKDFCKLATDICTDSLIEAFDSVLGTNEKRYFGGQPNRKRVLIEEIRECAETMDSEAGFKQCLAWTIESNFNSVRGNPRPFQEGRILETYNKFKKDILSWKKEADKMVV